MRLTRRQLLIGSALGWILSRVLPSRATMLTLPVTSSWPSQPIASTLAAYVDVLIPADVTPSATALDVDKQLLAVASGQQDYQTLLELGLDWLNRRAREQYGGHFPELDEGSREAVVAQAAAAGYNTLPRVFFERTRADAFFHYYGRPESWPGITGYSGPPQPLGFLDYTRPPGTSR
jgi:hypothetical protein